MIATDLALVLLARLPRVIAPDLPNPYVRDPHGHKADIKLGGSHLPKPCAVQSDSLIRVTICR
jgi:hypothetical protein